MASLFRIMMRVVFFGYFVWVRMMMLMMLMMMMMLNAHR